MVHISLCDILGPFKITCIIFFLRNLQSSDNIGGKMIMRRHLLLYQV